MSASKEPYSLKEPGKAKKQVIIRYFSGVHLGLGHPGLTKLASKHGLKVNELGDGEYVLFANTRMTGIKLFAQNNCIAYYKSPSGRIDPRVIALIPRFFNGTRIDLDGALREVILKDIEKGK